MEDYEVVGTYKVYGNGARVHVDAVVSGSARIYKDAIIDGQAVIADGVSIGPWCHIGLGTKIGANVKIGRLTMINPGVTIAEGVWIGEGTRIGTGVTIGAGSYIGSAVYIGDGCSIGKGCKIEWSATLLEGAKLADATPVFPRQLIAKEEKEKGVSMKGETDKINFVLVTTPETETACGIQVSLTIYNRTAHAISMLDDHGNEWTWRRSSVPPPELEPDRRPAHERFPFIQMESVLGIKNDLPEEVPGTLYIVSKPVAQALLKRDPLRKDIVTPGMPIRDKEGRTMRVQGLVAYSPVNHKWGQFSKWAPTDAE